MGPLWQIKCSIWIFFLHLCLPSRSSASLVFIILVLFRKRKILLNERKIRANHYHQARPRRNVVLSFRLNPFHFCPHCNQKPISNEQIVVYFFRCLSWNSNGLEFSFLVSLPIKHHHSHDYYGRAWDRGKHTFGYSGKFRANNNIIFERSTIDSRRIHIEQAIYYHSNSVLVLFVRSFVRYYLSIRKIEYRFVALADAAGSVQFWAGVDAGGGGSTDCISLLSSCAAIIFPFIFAYFLFSFDSFRFFSLCARRHTRSRPFPVMSTPNENEAEEGGHSNEWMNELNEQNE